MQSAEHPPAKFWTRGKLAVAVFILALCAGGVFFWNLKLPPPVITLIIKNPDPEVAPFFGMGLAAFGDHALVAAGRRRGLTSYGDYDEIVGICVHLMHGETGKRILTLTDPDEPVDRRFGSTMLVHGSMVIVGSPGTMRAPSLPGAVHVFELDLEKPNPGRLLMTLRNPTPAEFDLFGSSLAVMGNRLAVGAPGVSDSSGEVLLFDLETGALIETISNPSGLEVEQFGSSLATDGELLLVGAPSAHADERYNGVTHVFRLGSKTTLERTISHPLPDRDGGDFGYGICIGHSGWFVSSPFEDDGHSPGDPAHISNRGSVYWIEKNSGKLRRQLVNPESYYGAQFGNEIGEIENYLVVSAPGHRHMTRDEVVMIGDAPMWLAEPSPPGCVYLFDHSSGKMEAKVCPPDSRPSDLFGSNLAVTRDGFYTTGDFREGKGCSVYRVVAQIPGPQRE